MLPTNQEVKDLNWMNPDCGDERAEQVLRHANLNLYEARQWQGYAASGNFVDAIKAVRRLTNCGLKDAKSAVELWVKRRRAEIAAENKKTHTFLTRQTEGGCKETVTVTENGDGTFTYNFTRSKTVSDLETLLRLLGRVVADFNYTD